MIWVSLGLILACGAWGARNTAALHASQAVDLLRMADEEAEWYADIRMRAARYSQPLDLSAELGAPTRIPYWQDPTGASGFSRYFLRRFAAKPHLPLSALAVGQSDLQPFAIPLRLETLFGGDRVYDYETPRALATGLFDLSFVLVFVLPLAIGAAAAALGAQERDQAILPFVASQPISPRQWWSVRVAALAAVFVPGIAAAVVVALATAGAPVVRAWSETLAALALVATHSLFWLAVAGWCLARGHGAVSTTSIIAALWLWLTVAVPLGGSFILQSVPSPSSPVVDVDELRRTTDAVQREADAVVARRLVAHLGPTVASVDPTRLDYSTRLVLITEEMEQRLAAQERRRQEYTRNAASVATIVSWLSPQVALHTALSDLAGTGTPRHQQFLQAVRAFQLELRAFMYPRVLEPVRSASWDACPDCPGRLTFTDYDVIPRFTMRDGASVARVRAALGTAGWLGILAAGVTLAGIGRARSWALES